MVGDRSAWEKKGKVSLAPRHVALAAARQGGGVGGAPSLFELGFFLFPLEVASGLRRGLADERGTILRFELFKGLLPASRHLGCTLGSPGSF